jgi:flagellar motor switch protein FliN/FliY
MAEDTKTKTNEKKTAVPVAPAEDEVITEDRGSSSAPMFEEIASKAEGASATDGERASRDIGAMMSVEMDVQIVLGHARMPIADVLKLGRGSVIDLDRRIGDPVDVVVNGTLVARANLVQTEDDRIGVTLVEVIRLPASN